MLLLALFVMAHRPARFSPADLAARAALRQAIDRLERTQISPAQFERVLPRSNIPTWKRLQQRIPSTRSGSADLAFVLAYYGVDYPRNLRRLLLPYSRWWRAVRRPHGAPSLHDMAVLETLPEDLRLLYLKHRDSRSLGSLMGLQLDGHWSEDQAEILSESWPGHAARMLRLAEGSTARLANLEDTLEYNSDLLGGRNKVLTELQQFSRHGDPRVAGAARELLSRLKRDGPP